MGDGKPGRGRREEDPAATIENVPDSVIEAALDIAVTYRVCIVCGRKQFVPGVPWKKMTHDCRECGYPIRVYE